MEDKNKNHPNNKPKKAEKDEGNNQWFTTGLSNYPDNRERRDGPGGEDGEKKRDK